VDDPDLGSDAAPAQFSRDVQSLLEADRQKRCHQRVLFVVALCFAGLYLAALLAAICWTFCDPQRLTVIVAAGPHAVALVIVALIVGASIPLSLGMMLSKLVADRPSKDDSPVQIALPQTEIVKALLQVISRDK